MKNLRKKFEIMCYRNRDKGIPNLMLFISIGVAFVYIAGQFTGSSLLYELLRFDRAAILRGQVWRLISYPLTYGYGFNIFLLVISLYCYCSLAGAMEQSWGRLKFNLFYFSGIFLVDLFAMIFGNTVIINGFEFAFPISAEYLNLSLLIAFATLYPEVQFTIFFVIPIKARILALVYLAISLYEVLNLSFPVMLFPLNLIPLIALANYFLFFGKDVTNLFPVSWKIRRQRAKQAKPQPQAKPIPFRKPDTAPKNYTHRCSVCGRTDATNPELDFRYCSRCTGYHCYCSEHISNHTHIEE